MRRLLLFEAGSHIYGRPLQKRPQSHDGRPFDAIVAMANGLITHFGPAEEDPLSATAPLQLQISNAWQRLPISAGFIDSHVHYPVNADYRCQWRAIAGLAEQVHVSDGVEIFR